MAQPVRNVLNNGQQSWDADVNDNFDQQWDIATPIPEHADFASLPAAAANENSIAMTVDDGRVYRSDGTAWIQIGQSTNQVNPGSAIGRLDISVAESGDLTGANQFTFAGLAPPGILLGVTAKIKVAVDINWDLGDAGVQTRYAANKAQAKNTFCDISDHLASGVLQHVIVAQDIIVFSNSGANWGAGEIEVTAHCIVITPRPDFP